jgi:hypothetical protein
MNIVTRSKDLSGNGSVRPSICTKGQRGSAWDAELRGHGGGDTAVGGPHVEEPPRPALAEQKLQLSGAAARASIILEPCIARAGVACPKRGERRRVPERTIDTAIAGENAPRSGAVAGSEPVEKLLSTE